MAKGTCTIKFYLKLDTKNAADFPIYCRIIYNRKKSEFSTGERLSISSWSKESGMPIRKPRIKETLTNIEERILEKKRALDFQNREISAKLLRDFYKHGDVKEITSFCIYFDEYVKKISALPDQYGDGTIKRYKCTIKHFKTFLKTQGKNDIYLTDLSLKVINDFDYHLRTVKSKQYDKPMSKNSANNYHKKMKAVLGTAKEEGLTDVTPYSKFLIKDEKVNRDFLTKEELKKWTEHSLGDNEALNKVRDVFLFSCYTGLRYTDAQEIVEDDIYIDENGNYFLAFIQNKTGNKELFPLLAPAVNIYHKYSKQREITGCILPRISNTKVNVYLKVIADLVGIKKKITHHVARHTFATTIALSNGVPLEMVSAFLGHSQIRTTKIYAKMTPEYKLEYAKMIDKKLKK